MSKFLLKDANIIDMHSQWIGESLLRVVVRHFGKKNRIMVDVQEFTAKRTSKARALKVATQAARRVGCASVDCITVSDMEFFRKSRRIETNEEVKTSVRHITFAFDGIN